MFVYNKYNQLNIKGMNELGKEYLTIFHVVNRIWGHAYCGGYTWLVS